MAFHYLSITTITAHHPCYCHHHNYTDTTNTATPLQTTATIIATPSWHTTTTTTITMIGSHLCHDTTTILTHNQNHHFRPDQCTQMSGSSPLSILTHKDHHHYHDQCTPVPRHHHRLGTPPLPPLSPRSVYTNVQTTTTILALTPPTLPPSLHIITTTITNITTHHYHHYHHHRDTPLSQSVSVSVSAQDGIVALGKAHTCSAPSLSSLPKVALETVPIFAWLNTDRSRPLRVECRPLPFSTPLSFRRSML